MKTRASIGEICFVVLQILKSRAFAVVLFTAGVVFACYYTVLPMSFVTICDNGEIQYAYTLTQDFDAILARYNVVIGAHDQVTFSGEGKAMEIDIQRAFPVYVTADGRTSRVYVTHATAAEALRLCQVELEAQDLLNFDLEQSLCEGDRVVVTRVDYRNTYYTEAVPYTVEYTPTSLLASGRKRVLTTGSNGSRIITLREKYLNDQLVSSREEAEYVTQAPVNATALLGQPGAAISPYEPFPGVVTDEKGAPVNYTAVDANMRTSGYCDGYVTASGLPAQVGHVGVDPQEIPYGTRLYIASADGTFVYGYCIAADTGGGILYQDLIDIDLFFNSRWECGVLGTKELMVYVLP